MILSFNTCSGKKKQTKILILLELSFQQKERKVIDQRQKTREIVSLIFSVSNVIRATVKNKARKE